jgi:hypothetical protein
MRRAHATFVVSAGVACLFSPTTFCHAQSFEIGQTAARNQTPAGIGLDLHVRPIQEPAILRRIAQDNEGRGRREDLRLRLRRASPRSVTRSVGTMAARVSPTRLESLLRLRLRPYLANRSTQMASKNTALTNALLWKNARLIPAKSSFSV